MKFLSFLSHLWTSIKIFILFWTVKNLKTFLRTYENFTNEFLYNKLDYILFIVIFHRLKFIF